MDFTHEQKEKRHSTDNIIYYSLTRTFKLVKLLKLQIGIYVDLYASKSNINPQYGATILHDIRTATSLDVATECMKPLTGSITCAIDESSPLNYAFGHGDLHREVLTH